MADFTWLPAHEATDEHVEAVLGAGGAARCRCQAYKVPGWIWRDTTQKQRDADPSLTRGPLLAAVRGGSVRVAAQGALVELLACVRLF